MRYATCEVHTIRSLLTGRGPTVQHAANIKVTPSFMCLSDPFYDINSRLISGIEVFDTCSMRDVAMRDVYFAVKKALEPRGKLPLLGKYIVLIRILSNS
jgi:hypothetical protein